MEGGALQRRVRRAPPSNNCAIVGVLCKKSLGEDAKLRQMLNSKISNQKSEIKSCRRSILSRK
jgi:hypothetical protein